MFSISAINDTDTRNQWEPLAPTKEAQEFHLTQTYHDGLLKLEAKEYEKARELLESVLKDHLIASAQVDGEAGDSHLLQLRFLALKNLATVFLQQGSAHYESALRCYLQAAEIDSKDSVVWNQLGTLSCSMGLWSISRWAFEQGLVCSPNNWNCMEKLLEVLIAIRDEVACLSVAELILRHWPSHSRALHVKSTIEESEPVPYAPKGIDKLEPKHVRLKFIDKRKATEDNLDEDVKIKKLKQNIELHLAESSWVGLVDALLDILRPLSGCGPEVEVEKALRSGDVRLKICLPPCSDFSSTSMERKELTSTSINDNTSLGDANIERTSSFKEKEACNLDEHPQERRSTRLRSRKPGKEELEYSTGKDVAGVVTQYLEPFISGGSGTKDTGHDTRCSVSYPDQENSWASECSNVHNFLVESSTNYGAYHLSHLLLEKLSSTYPSYQDAFIKFLDLEKLSRHWGKERSSECDLFLAELYYDFGSSFSDTSKKSEFMSEASYHLCKIIELVALEYPLNLSCVSKSGNSSSSLQGASRISSENSSCQDILVENSLLMNKKPFWVRFFWLSGQLSLWDENKGKACEEFCISLSLLEKENDINDSLSLVCLPHCQVLRRLTFDRILYEINILKVDFLMENTVPEMFEKEMYMECITLLSPLLFGIQEVDLEALSLHFTGRKDEGINSVELAAIEILIKSCEKAKYLEIDAFLNSHRRKLQILMAAAGMHEYFTSCKASLQKSEIKTLSVADVEPKESPSKHWNQLVTEELKAISQCISQIKNSIEHSRDSNDFRMSSICDMQFLLLSVMCNVVNVFLCKKSSGATIADQVERSCFVDAAIAFCKLQHLDLFVPVKSQVELIVALHDLLAEYGLCCWGEGEGEEGTFLKFSIKHLLALDMKLKSNSSINGKRIECDDLDLQNSQAKTSPNKSELDAKDLELDQNDETKSMGKDDLEEGTTPEAFTTHKSIVKDATRVEPIKQGSDESDGRLMTGDNNSDQLIECENQENDYEKEELELKIDNALDQCFFCLYGLNLRCDSSYEDDLSLHKNTSRGDYQTKEQCADVFQYILPYAKASSRTGLVKVRRVLRAIRKHFSKPPEDVLAGNVIDKFLDDPNLCEEKLSDEAGSDVFLVTMMKILLNDTGSIKQYRTSVLGSSEPYLEVYSNLYYFLAQSEEMNATDKWPGFVLTKEGEEFVQHNANLFKYDLLYNPLRFESWQKLANIYDEEVDLLLNDGSKHVNVAGWRKNDTLPQRVEISRRRSRRCLLMSLALAKSTSQQREIHELLALVYYDSLQNVVPFYDQRSVVPSKDEAWIKFCENSMKHFKKASAHQQDWSHAFYMGKLSEKLGHSHDIPLSYYAKAVSLNPSAVDSIYRMHASRIKILGNCGKQNLQALKDLSAHALSQSTADAIMENSSELDHKRSDLPADKDSSEAYFEDIKHDELPRVEGAWHMLYNDCLSALESCVEGDLKHFHKARYALAQALYRRGESGDLDRAKDELSFCFKSSRSSFTINMWEIDSMVKKGRRKTPSLSGNKKALEVNLPESSRKFITCIRKYLLFYLKLLEETGDICTLERAYISLRADKRFSLCIEDLVPVALGMYVKVLITSIRQVGIASSGDASSYEHILEKMFALFMEQGNLWPELCSLPEIKGPGISESNLFGYLHDHIITLERNVKVENLEAINEKIRKRFKNPKLSNNNIAKVCRHASIAWCRSLIISLALITPLHSEPSTEIQMPSTLPGGSENNQQLCVDLHINELWSSTFEDSTHLRSLEPKWCPILSQINNVFVKRAADVNWETANSLLRSTYNFYRESSCVTLPSGLNLYLVPYRLETGINFQKRVEGAEALDLSMPRKLLLWAYTLVHGHSANISAVVKHCEEHLKSKIKKGAGNPSTQSHANFPTVMSTPTVLGSGKDGANYGGETDAAEATAPSTPSASASLPESHTTSSAITLVSSGDTRKSSFQAPQLHHCNNTIAANGGDPDKG